MGSKKKMWKKPEKKEKPRAESALMTEVEKTNPEFVKWLRARKGKSESSS